MAFGTRKDCSHAQASHTSRRGSDTRRSETSKGRWMSHKPRPTRGRRAGWHGRVGGLADWQTAGGQQRVQGHRMHRLGGMDVLSSTSGASRTAELLRRLVPLGAT